MSTWMSRFNIDAQCRRKVMSVFAALYFASTVLAVGATAQASAPTDPQIVGIVIAADDIDINYAELAMTKAKDEKVRSFAQQMITDHTAVQKSVLALASTLNVTPADSPTSGSLKSQAQEMMQKLRSLKSKEFEKAYIDNEVAYHQAVIGATKAVLIPSAQNPDLKSALQQALPLFEGHLQHAQRVQASVDGGGKAASSNMSDN